MYILCERLSDVLLQFVGVHYSTANLPTMSRGLITGIGLVIGGSCNVGGIGGIFSL